MRMAGLVLIILTVAVAAAGVWTVGGPGQARAERRDQERMTDLNSLARHLACLHRQGLEPGDSSDACPTTARRTDPRSNEPYEVQAVTDDFVRVCASSRHSYRGTGGRAASTSTQKPDALLRPLLVRAPGRQCRQRGQAVIKRR